MARYDLTIARYREARSLELALQGMPWDEIAEQLGYKDRSGPWKAAHRVLDRQAGIAGERYRGMRLWELDEEQRRVWPAAVSGDLDAAMRALNIMDKRHRLAGLIPKPTPVPRVRPRPAPSGGPAPTPPEQSGHFVDLVVT